jgi:hypothetical protein
MDKEIGSSMINRSLESLQGDADSMEECFTSKLYFTVNRFIDEIKKLHRIGAK